VNTSACADNACRSLINENETDIIDSAREDIIYYIMEGKSPLTGVSMILRKRRTLIRTKQQIKRNI